MFKLKNERNIDKQLKENKNTNKKISKNKTLNNKEHTSILEQQEKYKSSTVLRDAIKFNFFNKLDEPYETGNKFDSSKTSNKILPINGYNYPEDMLNIHHQINSALNTKSIDKQQITNFNSDGNIIENNAYNTANMHKTRNQLMMNQENNSNPSDSSNINHITFNKLSNTEDRFYNNNTNNSYPSLITPIMKNSINNPTNSSKVKQAINLEDLFIQEEKIWNILEAIRFNSNISSVCDEYFDFQNMNSLQNLHCYFQNSEIKEQIKLSITLETYSIVSISLILIKNKIDSNSLSHSKNLIYYIHQNFSVIIKIIINKLPKEFIDNMWVMKLKKVLIARNIEIKGEFNTMQQGNSFILSMLKKFINTYFKSKEDIDLFSILEDVLFNITKYSYNTVKNIMFNIV